MSYMGKNPIFGSYAVQLLSGNGSTTSFTLTHAPASPSTLLVTISGVKQQAAAYSVTDTNIDFGVGNAPPSGTNNIEVLYLGQRVDVGSVADDAIATAKLADNAVTLAKLEDGTQGDILYYGASGAPTRLGFGTSGDFLKTQGTGANPVWGTVAAGGGLTMADQWRLTTNFSGTQNPISSNLERVDTPQQATLGSAMTESSGVFTFPETGYYFVLANGAGSINNATERSQGINISVTINNSTWANIANATMNGFDSNDDTTSNASCSLIVDVTDTANVKVRFYGTTVNGSSVFKGSSTDNLTFFTFLRLADT